MCQNLWKRQKVDYKLSNIAELENGLTPASGKSDYAGLDSCLLGHITA